MNAPIKSRAAQTIAQRLRLTFLPLIAAPALIAATTALAASPAANAPAIDMNSSDFQARLETAYERLEERGFSGIVAVAVGDGPAIYKGFGDRAAQTGLPRADTQVDIGSITKTITAAAAMKLVDDGKLATSDRLSDFFPEAPADKAPITVHQLLTHSSGLADAVADDFDRIDRAAFLKRAFAEPLQFEPGTGYAYSNVGYSVMAAIIEIISGKSYDAFLQEELFVGAGVENTGYKSALDPARSMLNGDGENVAAASWGGDTPYWALIGNGGLLSTAEDMIAFRKAFAAGEIVSPAAVQLAQSPMVREGDDAPTHAGFGLVVDDHPAMGRLYWHNGGNPSFTSNWTDYADKGVVTFTASNARDFNADFAAFTIAEALFDVIIFPPDFDARRDKDQVDHQDD